MKYVKNLLLVLAIIPFLTLQSVETRADGGEDPPHGRPEFRDDTVGSRGGFSGSSGATRDEIARESNVVETSMDSPAGLWNYIDMLLGNIL